jgi:kynureninase
VEILTPAQDDARGCQLSLRLTAANGGAAAADGARGGARAVHDRLQAAGVIVDWREPDILRLAPTPLYNSFSDCFAAARALAAIVAA